MEVWKEELYHSQGPWKKHAYVRKFKNAAGKWVYEYKNKAGVTTSSGSYDEGEHNRQSWKSIDTKNGATLMTYKGSNREDKYAGVSVGKVKDDYKYKEKEVKAGRVSLYYDNENGTHNVSVHVAHKPVKSLAPHTVSKGSAIVKKMLGM